MIDDLSDASDAANRGQSLFCWLSGVLRVYLPARYGAENITVGRVRASTEPHHLDLLLALIALAAATPGLQTRARRLDVQIVFI